MSDLLSSNKPVTIEEAGYQKVGAIEHGSQKEILLRTADLPAGGEGGEVDLTGYLKKTDVTGASAQAAADGVKLLIADTDGSFKSITLADLKAFINA